MGAYRIGMAFNKCHQISTHPIFDNLFTASLIKMMGSSRWYDIDYTDPKPRTHQLGSPPVSGPDSKKSTELEKKRFPMPLELWIEGPVPGQNLKSEEKEINGRRRLGASLGTSGPPPA
jgi:hypothetical protein